MKRRQSEKGQAFAETVICMVAICSVFIGLLFIADLSMHSVKNYLQAREEADQEAAITGDVLVNQGEYISGFEVGDDGLRYTYDDVSRSDNDITMDVAEGDDPDFFIELIQKPDFPLQHDLPGDCYTAPTVGTLFLNGANLVKGRASYSLPSDNEAVCEEMIIFLLGRNQTINIEDEVFIPGVNW